MIVNCSDAEVFAPKFSKDVHIIMKAKEHVHFDTLSRRRIRESVRKIVMRQLLCFKKLWKLAVRLRFEHWAKLTKDLRKPQQFNRLALELIHDKYSKIVYYREGLRILSSYLYFKYKCVMSDYLSQWKKQTDYDHNLKIKYISKWNIKASRWKLSKMNAYRFIQLMQPCVKVIEKNARVLYFHKWKLWLERYYTLLDLYTNFKYWHLRVKSIILCRRRQKLNAIKRMKDSMIFCKHHYERCSHQTQVKIEHNHMKHGFLHWLSMLHKKHIMLRVLMKLCVNVYRKVWLKWTHIPPSLLVETTALTTATATGDDQSELLSPMKSPEPKHTAVKSRSVQKNKKVTSSYKKVVFQGGAADANVAYRQILIQKKKKKLPHGKVKPFVPVLNSKGKTLQERIEIRLNIVKEMIADDQAKWQAKKLESQSIS